MDIFETEKLVLGLVLRHGSLAAKYVLPELTHNRFVCGASGEFGTEHQTIWQTVEVVFLAERAEPSITNLLAHLGSNYAPYLKMLVDKLPDYGLYDLDIDTLRRLAVEIDKSGIVFDAGRAGGSLYNNTLSMEIFNRTLQSIEDIDSWLNGSVSRFTQITRSTTTGYLPVSAVAESTRQMWDRMRAGEQLALILTGIPALEANQIYPLANTTVLHGMSSAGKTAFALMSALGAAITLKVNRIKGCVAINSMEMSKESLLGRLASMLSRVDYTRLRGGKVPLFKAEYERLLRALDFVATLPIFIDPTSLLTTEAMQYKSTGLNAGENGPVWMLMTDYGELFADKEGDSKEQRLDQVFRNQFYISRLLGCSVLAISQSTFSDSTYIAGPNGLRYSTGIRQSADVIIEIYNPVYMKSAGINYKSQEHLPDYCAWALVQKYRDGGMIGAIPLGWLPEYTLFYDLNWNRDTLKTDIGHERMFAHTTIEQELLARKVEFS